MIFSKNNFSLKLLSSQSLAGIVVFLIALPLSLGIALASGAPLFSGILGGVVGGIVVGFLSDSSIGISGPSAALAAVVAQQIIHLNSFEAFLLALLLAGLIQVLLGICRAGFIAEFFPSSVIKGLLAATGTLIVLKQIPHLVGYDPIAFGDNSFLELDGQNTFGVIGNAFYHFQQGALFIGLFSLFFLLLWNRINILKNFIIPAPLFIVLFALLLSELFRCLGGDWVIGPDHLVQVPKMSGVRDFVAVLRGPDFKNFLNPEIYKAAVLIAACASLETLLNLEASDKIDPEQRISSPHRELIAQGIGNIILGFIGGLPITSAIVRTSANVQAGGRTRTAAIFHGVLLLFCLLFFSTQLNKIPLSALSAILVIVGAKLASPQLFRQMWNGGKDQFLPFIITILAIIFTNLLIGILIGLGVGLLFILHSNLSAPIQKTLEKHPAGDVVRIDLANQVSFLNRPSLVKILDELPNKTQLLFDARTTHYIDPDILNLIDDFIKIKAPVRKISVSLLGFKDKAQLCDKISFIDYSTKKLQTKLTPSEVLEIMKEGNKRFYEGRPLLRDHVRQVQETSHGQHPMGVILSCIDSRAPGEIIFDVGLGDFFSIRMAGNVASVKELACMEYSCVMAGAKLIVVLGHSSCGAMAAAIDFYQRGVTVGETDDCKNLDVLLAEIQQQIDPVTCPSKPFTSQRTRGRYVDALAEANVLHTVRFIRKESAVLDQLVSEGKINIVGAFYNVATGRVNFLK
ncbi:MAG: bifunctional SulP family inorganic anion transporter/carbonic anhydrase [Chthoniobacterales bacterium]